MGSLVQTVTAVLVVTLFAATGQDPGLEENAVATKVLPVATGLILLALTVYIAANFGALAEAQGFLSVFLPGLVVVAALAGLGLAARLKAADPKGFARLGSGQPIPASAAVAGSRLLVERGIYDAFCEKIVAITEKMRVGDPLSLQTEAGAISSEAQLFKNLGFVESGLAEGARLKTGGGRIFTETGGFYMQPTIFEVTPAMPLAREEVFGPILSVIPFEGEEEALRIANATEYGLASAVWTGNLSRAHRMLRGVRAGVVHVNTYGGADGTVPLGGVRQSGNGHDKSLHAFGKYTDLKTAWIQL